MRLPIEFRTAIGVSNRPDLFDGSRILSLCARDPYVSEDPAGGPGNLVVVNVRDAVDTVFSPRLGYGANTPQAIYRTGWGVRLAWTIEATVATSRLGFLPSDYPRRPEINDGSLFHLLSVIGSSASIDQFESSQFPPYLFLTTNYQDADERWFPVDVDPNNVDLDPLAFDEGKQTASRTFRARFVSKDTYRRALVEYVPSVNVHVVPGIIVTAMPPLTPAGTGNFFTQLTLNLPLPDDLGVTDRLLVNIGGLYGWKLFAIQRIENLERTIVTVSTTSDMGGSFAIPPAPPCDEIRSVKTSRYLMMPTYCIEPFAGSAPEKKQLPLVSARLLGELGCPPGTTPGTAPPAPPDPTTTLRYPIPWFHNLGNSSYYVWPLTIAGGSYPALKASDASAAWSSRDSYTAAHETFPTSNPAYASSPNAECANVFAYRDGTERGAGRAYVAVYTGFLGTLIAGRPFTVDSLALRFYFPYGELATASGDPRYKPQAPRSDEDRNIYIVPAAFVAPPLGGSEWLPALWSTDPPAGIAGALPFRILDFPQPVAGDGNNRFHEVPLGAGFPAFDVNGWTRIIICSDEDYTGADPVDDPDHARNLVSFCGFDFVVQLTIHG